MKRHTFATVLKRFKAKLSAFFQESDTSDRHERVLIGNLLKRRNIITDQQLRHALEIQKNRQQQLVHPIHLGLIMVELGYATEHQVIDVVNAHYGLDIASLSENIESLLDRKKRIPFHRLLSRPVPVRTQLSLLIAFFIVFTTFILGAITIRQQRSELFGQMVRIGKVSLNYFAENARILLLEKHNQLELNTLITEAANTEGLEYAAIVTPDGLIIAHTDYRLIGESYMPPASTVSTEDEDGTRYYDYYAVTGERLLNIEKDISWSGQHLGDVHVGVSLDFIKDRIYQKGKSIFIVSLLVVGVGVAAAVLLGIYFSMPISELVRATQEIGKGNYHYRVRIVRNDELGNLAEAFNHMSQEIWRKSLMQRSFGKYVGTEVLELILLNPESEWLKGRRSEATVLFTDIRGFTAYAKDREPEAVVERLNIYFEIATATIAEYGGYVDKFVGDAVMGVFGVPVFREDHVRRAVLAAIAMQNRFFCKNSEDSGGFLDRVGIGIHTGVVVSGNIGSKEKMEYTVIGDTVNFASRINGLADSGEIMISEAVRNRMGHALMAETRPACTVKGVDHPVIVYCLQGVDERYS